MDGVGCGPLPAGPWAFISREGPSRSRHAGWASSDRSSGWPAAERAGQRRSPRESCPCSRQRFERGLPREWRRPGTSEAAQPARGAADAGVSVTGVSRAFAAWGTAEPDASDPIVAARPVADRSPRTFAPRGRQTLAEARRRPLASVEARHAPPQTPDENAACPQSSCSPLRVSPLLGGAPLRDPSPGRDRPHEALSEPACWLPPAAPTHRRCVLVLAQRPGPRPDHFSPFVAHVPHGLVRSGMTAHLNYPVSTTSSARHPNGHPSPVPTQLGAAAAPSPRSGRTSRSRAALTTPR